MFYIRRVLFLSLFIVLSGCQTTPFKTNSQAASTAIHEQHLQNISKINEFTIIGRIGVQADGKGFSGSINWQHQPQSDSISIFSPLGGQLAKIFKTADKVTLTDAKGNSISAIDTELLTQQLLGWKLPLKGLTDWALGRPTNSSIESISWDDQGHLLTLNQDGWNIEFLEYRLQNSQFLPNKILLKNDKAILRLRVDNTLVIN